MTNKFNEEIIQLVWEKALVIEGLDKLHYRMDHCGAIIRRDMYGKTKDKLSMGWVIDKIRPTTLGGNNDLFNYQPLQWENSQHKAEQYPTWTCNVKAGEKSNRYIKQD